MNSSLRILRAVGLNNARNLYRLEVIPSVMFRHMETSAPNSSDEQIMRRNILENALKFVPELGFTTEAINKGVVETGLSSAATNGIFRNGSFDLIDYFYKKSNKDLSIYLEGLVEEGVVTKKNEFIRLAIIHRLKLTQPFIKHWPQAMAVMTFNPSFAITAIENLLRLCDEIWYQAGDNSVDFNWYTKRLTLAGIYKSTEFFMIQDTSENFTETIKFLDNRFYDLGQFYKLKSQFENTGENAAGLLSVIKNVLNIRN